MGAHTIHRSHVNSGISFAAVDLGTRASLVLNAYLLAGAPLSDRDVLKRLGFSDMNSVRPSITGLIDEGLLWECGDVVCEITGRKVRLCAPTAKALAVRS